MDAAPLPAWRCSMPSCRNAGAMHPFPAPTRRMYNVAHSPDPTGSRVPSPRPKRFDDMPTRPDHLRIMMLLVMLHIAVIAASNYLVQFPFTLFGFNTTWGAYTYPTDFLAADLTVRMFGARQARRIIFRLMYPALIVSYVISAQFVDGRFAGSRALMQDDIMATRIVLDSFSAYVV